MLNDLKSIFYKKKLSIIVVLIVSLICSICLVIIPFLTGKYIDELTINHSSYLIYNILVLYFLFRLLNIFLICIYQLISLNLKSKISFEIINYFNNRLSKVPLKIFQDYDSVYLSQRISSDANKITEFLLSDTYQFILTLLNLLLMFIIIININLKLSLLLVIGIFVNIFTYYLSRNKINKSSLIYFEEQNNYSQALNEPFKFSKLIKLHSFQSIFKDRISNKFSAFLKSLMNYIKVDCFYSAFQDLTSLILITILFLLSARDISNNIMTVGEVTIVLNYFYSALSYVGTILNSGKNYQEAKVSYIRLLDIYNINLESNGNIDLSNIDSIELSNISYEDNGSIIIDKFNYKFEKGNIYIIKGNNGTGKSTFLYIINKILEKSSGNIYINGIDIDLLDMYSIRKNSISFLEQEPILINDSIFNNITYNIKDIHNLEYFIDLLNLNTCFDKFELGIHTHIKDNLENISGGEKQKIALSRALLKDTSILILDEPTSALDKSSCKLIKNYFESIKNNKIIIAVTHDESFIEVGDYILDINQIVNQS